MVLTEEQFNDIQSNTHAGQEGFHLFQLREKTSSFLIQCLADREIQRLLDRKNRNAYEYNSKVVHNPYAFSQVRKL